MRRSNRPGAQQGFVQAFRAVGRCQDDHPFPSVESVHFGQQLVEGLFPFVVSSEGSVPPLADGVYLVDEDDARRLLVGLLEQVSDLGGSHSDEHLYEFGA